MAAGELVRLPADAPTGFVPAAWRSVLRDAKERIDMRVWELALAFAVSEALRSGDLYLPESRQHVSFWNLVYGADKWKDRREVAYVELQLPPPTQRGAGHAAGRVRSGCARARGWPGQEPIRLGRRRRAAAAQARRHRPAPPRARAPARHRDPLAAHPHRGSARRGGLVVPLHGRARAAGRLPPSRAEPVPHATRRARRAWHEPRHHNDGRSATKTSSPRPTPWPPSRPLRWTGGKGSPTSSATA